MMSIYKQRMLK